MIFLIKKYSGYFISFYSSLVKEQQLKKKDLRVEIP